MNLVIAHLLSLCAAFFYFLCCLSAGSLVTRFIGLRKKLSEAGPLFLTNFGLGLAAYTLLWLCVGIAGLFSKAIIFPILALTLVLSLIFERSFWRQLAQNQRSILVFFFGHKDRSWGWRLLAFLTFFFILLQLPLTQMPLGADAVAFYMLIPKLLVYAQRLEVYPLSAEMMQIPLFGKLHSAALFSVSGLESARYFVFFLEISFLAALWELGKKFCLNPLGQLISLVISITTTSILFNLYYGALDSYGLFVSVVALYWLTNLDEMNNYRLALAAFFTGFAIYAKLPNVITFAAILFIVVGASSARRPLSLVHCKKLLLKFCYAGFWAALPLGMWVLKNLALYKDPFLPFVTLTNYPAGLPVYQSWFSPEVAARVLKSFPLVLFYGQYVGQGGHLSILVLCFLPLLLFVPDFWKRMNRLMRIFFVASLSALFLWAVLKTYPGLRYFFAPLVLLSVWTAWLCQEALKRSPKPVQPFLLSVMLFVLLGHVTMSLKSRLPRVWAFAQGTEQQYERDWVIAKWVNENIPPGTRGYLQYCCVFPLRPDIIYSAVKEFEPLQFPTWSTEPISVLKKLGVSYAIVVKGTNQHKLIVNDSSSLPRREVFSYQNNIIYRFD